MSQEIKHAFYNAMVANAAYADFALPPDHSALSGEPVSKLLELNYHWTPAMANYFAAHYAVVDVAHAATSYDAILFRMLDASGNPTAHYVLGNRGTEPTHDFDLASDLALAVSGLSAQVLSMNDFISSTIVPLQSANVYNTIDVAGHSLGGFLTTWAMKKYGDIFDYGYTYNGAGVGPLPATVINQLRALLGEEPLTRPGPVDNYYNGEWPNVVSAVGVYTGSRIPVNVDYPDTLGHGMGPLTDALAVAYLLSEIDTSLTLPVINTLVEAASKDDTLDRNKTIAYLGKLFGLDVSTFEKAEDEAELQRVLFNILQQAEAKPDDSDFNARLLDIAHGHAGDLADLAQADNLNGELMRYALINGATFALQAPSAALAGLDHSQYARAA